MARGKTARRAIKPDVKEIEYETSVANLLNQVCKTS